MTQIKVVLSGFFESETNKFQQIFSFSQSRERSYTLSDVTPDMILVNVQNQEALDKSLAYTTQHPEITLVTIGRTHPENQSTFHIAPPYITSRVLRALDQIKIEVAIPDNKPTTTTTVEATTIEHDENRVEASNQYHVLVVDDSPSMQKMLEIELSQVELNINIDFADTGEEALEKTDKKHYDFIFLDIMMPGIDGYEGCKTIRKNPDEKKTPIIMLSSKTSPQDEVKGVIAECTMYLTKRIAQRKFQGAFRKLSKGWFTVAWVEDRQRV
uniref:CheY subfamily protein n=1 Tax=uncultured organism TaxID=155900 RepID=E3T306_9ZZZZ|nr:CheY subfamily protein [uncultured organism]